MYTKGQIKEGRMDGDIVGSKGLMGHFQEGAMDADRRETDPHIGELPQGKKISIALGNNN